MLLLTPTINYSRVFNVRHYCFAAFLSVLELYGRHSGFRNLNCGITYPNFRFSNKKFRILSWFGITTSETLAPVERERERERERE